MCYLKSKKVSLHFHLNSLGVNFNEMSVRIQVAASVNLIVLHFPLL